MANGYEAGDCGEDYGIIFESPPENPVGTTTAMLGGWKGTTLATFNSTAPGGAFAGTGDGWQPGDMLSNDWFKGS